MLLLLIVVLVLGLVPFFISVQDALLSLQQNGKFSVGFAGNSTTSWVARSDRINITLQVSGRCRSPSTYLGVDSRSYLLSHYDISAVPVKSYAPYHRNWARIILLNSVMERCSQAKWFIYSDTDAYIPSRSRLEAKLEHIHGSVIFQTGMWYVNSGFHAWKNDNNARQLLREWEKRYSNSTDFFAEQRAMLLSVRAHQKYTAAYDNGFLGWHIKGSARYKTDVANAGRMGCRYEQMWIVLTVVPVVALGICILITRLRMQLLKRASPGMQLLHDMLFSEGCFFFISTLLLLVMFLDVIPGSTLRNGRDMSSQNPTHILANGRKWWDKHKRLVCSQFWCSDSNRADLLGIWRSIASNKNLTVLAFIVSDFVDKTLWKTMIAVLITAWICLAMLIMLQISLRFGIIVSSLLRWRASRRHDAKGLLRP